MPVPTKLKLLERLAIGSTVLIGSEKYNLDNVTYLYLRYRQVDRYLGSVA